MTDLSEYGPLINTWADPADIPRYQRQVMTPFVPKELAGMKTSVTNDLLPIQDLAPTGHDLTLDGKTWRCRDCKAATMDRSILLTLPCLDNKPMKKPTDPTYNEQADPRFPRLGDTWKDPWHGTVVAVDDEEGRAWVTTLLNRYRYRLDTIKQEMNPLCQKFRSTLCVPDTDLVDGGQHIEQYTDFLFQKMLKGANLAVQTSGGIRVSRWRHTVNKQKHLGLIEMTMSAIIRPIPEEH